MMRTLAAAAAVAGFACIAWAAPGEAGAGPRAPTTQPAAARNQPAMWEEQAADALAAVRRREFGFYSPQEEFESRRG